jgi:HEAT repeat protein
LIDALNEAAPYVRRRAYAILAKLDLSESLPRLQQALEKSGPESRGLIVQLVNRLSVAPIGMQTAAWIDMQSIVRSLSDPDSDVRSKALSDLISAERAYLAALPGSVPLPHLSQEARSHWLGGLSHLDWGDRGAWAAGSFAKGLADCASAETPVGPLTAVLAILESEQAPNQRQELIQRLASLCRMEVWSRFRCYSYPREAKVRSYRYAPRLPASLIRALIAIIHTEDPERSAPLRQVLLRTDMTGYVPELLATLDSPHGEMRKYSVCGLAKVGQFTPEALRAVIAALDDSSCVVRRAAMRALNDLSNGRRKVRRSRLHSPAQATSAESDRIAVLEMALQSGSAGARAWAAQRLPVVGSQYAGALNRLVALLGDPEPEVRVAAVRALGRFREAAREAMDRLNACLQDESPNVRRAAADVSALLKGTNSSSAHITG